MTTRRNDMRTWEVMSRRRDENGRRLALVTCDARTLAEAARTCRNYLPRHIEPETFSDYIRLAEETD